MDERVQGIEEVGKKGRSGEVTDAARDAIMQAALKRAGGGEVSDAEMAEAASNSEAVNQAQQVQQTADAQQGQDANVKEAEKVSPERQKATEKMLTSAVDLMALNNLNNLGIVNPVKTAQVQNTLNESMMQAAMNKANPATSNEANKNMANASQGVTSVADTARKDEQTIQTQQVYETGASSKMQDAKDSGLSIGVKIEAPDATNNQTATGKLLAGSMEQLAAQNMNNLGISSAPQTD